MNAMRAHERVSALFVLTVWLGTWRKHAELSNALFSTSAAEKHTPFGTSVADKNECGVGDDTRFSLYFWVVSMRLLLERAVLEGTEHAAIIFDMVVRTQCCCSTRNHRGNNRTDRTTSQRLKSLWLNSLREKTSLATDALVLRALLVQPVLGLDVRSCAIEDIDCDPLWIADTVSRRAGARDSGGKCTKRSSVATRRHSPQRSWKGSSTSLFRKCWKKLMEFPGQIVDMPVPRIFEEIIEVVKVRSENHRPFRWARRKEPLDNEKQRSAHTLAWVCWCNRLLRNAWMWLSWCLNGEFTSVPWRAP